MRNRIEHCCFYSLLLASAVAAADVDQPIAFLGFTDGYWQAWVMATDGSDMRQVTVSDYDKARISWYPDGQHLLVNGNQGTLARVSVATGNEEALEIGVTGTYDAVISPDGGHIAYSVSPPDSRDGNDIWIVNTADGQKRKLTRMNKLQHDPAWALDGESIYFLSGEGQQVHDIWRVAVDGSSKEQLTAGALYHFDVAVGPVGELAFSSNRTGNYEIWTRSADGKLEQITDHEGLDAKPAWSAEGDALVFESSRDGRNNIWTVSLDDRALSQLTVNAVGARSPVWFNPGSPN